jgi:hypothetical protein
MTVLGRRIEPQRNGNLEAAGATAFRSGHKYLLPVVKGNASSLGEDSPTLTNPSPRVKKYYDFINVKAN